MGVANNLQLMSTKITSKKFFPKGKEMYQLIKIIILYLTLIITLIKHRPAVQLIT